LTMGKLSELRDNAKQMPDKEHRDFAARVALSFLQLNDEDDNDDHSSESDLD